MSTDTTLLFNKLMTPERKARLLSVLNKRQENITVVFENIFDPHNVAAVMRTCDAVGVQEVYLISSRRPPRKKWGYRSGSGAKKWLTIHEFGNTADCIAAVRQNYDRILTTSLSSNAVGLYEVDFTGSVALVFGNEHTGVSEELVSLADGNFLIPQVGIIRSLNISVACAVTLYEAYRQKEMAGHYRQRQLPGNKVDILFEKWGFNEDKCDENEE